MQGYNSFRKHANIGEIILFFSPHIFHKFIFSSYLCTRKKSIRTSPFII